MTEPILHCSNNGRALCDGRELDPNLTSDSPECRGMRYCTTCHLLLIHWCGASRLRPKAPDGAKREARRG
jgi:hypothetical protein